MFLVCRCLASRQSVRRQRNCEQVCQGAKRVYCRHDLILEKSKPEGVLNNVVNILNFTKIFKIILRILFQHSPQKSSQGSH
jgi:hypothetical protein